MYLCTVGTADTTDRVQGSVFCRALASRSAPSAVCYNP